MTVVDVLNVKVIVRKAAQAPMIPALRSKLSKTMIKIINKIGTANDCVNLNSPKETIRKKSIRAKIPPAMLEIVRIKANFFVDSKSSLSAKTAAKAATKEPSRLNKANEKTTIKTAKPVFSVRKPNLGL